MAELAPEPTPAQPLMPPLLLTAALVCVAGAAALADCALLAALLKRSRTGLYSVIIQLAVADIILLGTTIGPELWSLNVRTWHFGSGSCTAFQGLNVFTHTITTYLVIAIALHSLTTIRLEKKSMDRKLQRKGREEDEEIRSSQHSLVANSDSSTPPRTMNVDYRISDTRVPVTLPSVFVWTLSLSLSIPEFVLATIVSHGKNGSTCTLDFSHQYNIQMMLAIFTLLLPLFIMSILSVLIIVKLASNLRKTVKESMAEVRFPMWLMCLHLILCTPRAIMKTYNAYTASFQETVQDYSLPSDSTTLINLVLSSTYLLALLIRPLMCIMSLPQITSVFLRRKISDTDSA